MTTVKRAIVNKHKGNNQAHPKPHNSRDSEGPKPGKNPGWYLSTCQPRYPATSHQSQSSSKTKIETPTGTAKPNDVDLTQRRDPCKRQLNKYKILRRITEKQSPAIESKDPRRLTKSTGRQATSNPDTGKQLKTERSEEGARTEDEGPAPNLDSD